MAERKVALVVEETVCHTVGCCSLFARWFEWPHALCARFWGFKGVGRG